MSTPIHLTVNIETGEITSVEDNKYDYSYLLVVDGGHSTGFFKPSGQILDKVLQRVRLNGVDVRSSTYRDLWSGFNRIHNSCYQDGLSLRDLQARGLTTEDEVFSA